MTKHDRLFLGILATSLTLIGLIMADNIDFARQQAHQEPSTVPAASIARQKLIEMKLPLHEGKHWRTIHE